jgi:release factor glutamine methyltransferase
MLVSTFRQYFHQKLENIIPTESERNYILQLLLEKRIEKTNKLTDEIIELERLKVLENDIYALQQNKPIQQIINEAWFYKFPFFVNEHCLIPRPETEELVLLVINYLKQNNQIVNILDVGTGSGCISICLKKELPYLQVTSIDISNKALAVAQQNSKALNAAIQFKELDFLNTTAHQFSDIQLIVSNPPYIPISDALQMEANVLAYEPHEALFVSDNDALIFYKKIAAIGQVLKIPIFVEISFNKGEETKLLFLKHYSNVQLIKDMQQNDRFIIAIP